MGASEKVKAYENNGGHAISKDEKDPILPNIMY